MSPSAFTRPSALLPMAMSLAALVTVLVHIALFGAARAPDESAAAHVFQLLIAAQVPIVAVFVARWLRRAPMQALSVLALQALAVVAALSPVWYFNL